MNLSPTVVAAKLGFERVAQSEAARHDTKLQGYVTELTPSEDTHYCPFVLDSESRYLVFEERPPDILKQSFIGAFRSLIRQSDYNLTVDLVTDPAIFQQWLSDVRLIGFTARLRRPNPAWRDEVREIRELLEGTNAEEIQVAAKVDADDPGAELRGGGLDYRGDGSVR